MGTFKKILGTVAAITGGVIIAKKVKESIDDKNERKKQIQLQNLEDEKRKNIKIVYDEILSFDDFERIAISVAKPIKRLNVEVYDGYIKGVVRTSSGISEWEFGLDFNDYGKITGWYKLSFCENYDSNIPQIYANQVSEKIKTFLEEKEKYDNDSNDKYSICSFCGSKINENSKFCSNCGRKVSNSCYHDDFLDVEFYKK